MLWLAVLSHFSQRIDEATNESNKDGGNAAEGDRSVEEDKAAESDGKLVQSADHGVGRRGCDTDGPSRSIRDEDSGKAGYNHDDDDGVALLRGEVLLDVGGRPVLDKYGSDKQNWNGQEVVVVHGCPQSVKA